MIFVPDFYKKFKCIADKCADSCCIGWEIDVDGVTLGKYRDMADESILSRIEIAANTPYIRLSDGDRCPFLDECGLCNIIKKYNDECIPEICKRHPRYYNDILDFTECSIGLSCPTAADIILSVTDKPKIEKISEAPTDGNIYAQKRDEIPTDEENTIKYLYDLRDKLFDFVFDKGQDIVGVVSGLISYQSEISDYLFDGTHSGGITATDEKPIGRLVEMLPEAISSIELLSEDLRELSYGVTKERLLSLLISNADTARSLLYYFLHRYFLSGASEFDLDDRLTLCALLLLISLLFIDGRDAVDGAVLFSKNVEYSTENIDILLGIIAEST